VLHHPRPGMADALSRFTRLETFILTASEHVTEQEAADICTALRAMPHLRTVRLSGPGFTDTALAPLAGHPGLTKIVVNGGHLTGRSAPTFASLPSLRELDIYELAPPAQDYRAAIQAGLPPHIRFRYAP
jgi:hypothetical protein